MMRCNDVRAILSHSGPGDAVRQSEFEAHLETCDGCRGFRDFLGQLEDDLRAGSDLLLPAPTLVQRIRAVLAKEQAPSRPDHERRDNKRMPHILAVDDEPNIVRLMQVNLERRGYRVETASNGAQALAKIKANRPDMLISDVMMPEMDGFELLANIRRDPALADLPVIMLTAKAADRDIMLGYQTGADMYLTKPFNPHELVQFVQRILAGSGDGNDAYHI